VLLNPDLFRYFQGISSVAVTVGFTDLILNKGVI